VLSSKYSKFINIFFIIDFQSLESLSLNALNPESDQRQCAGILSKMAI